jgi:purine-nucleoside phosphorylase
MSIHIGAPKGAIADKILLPGDPKRAQFIAEKYLENAECYNEVRGMLGFTGTYKGNRVSVQGTGMGMPSHGIYVHELINQYGVKKLIRVGSCGSMQKDIKIRDIVMALSASTDSSLNQINFRGMSYAPTASWKLISQAESVSRELGIPVRAGNVLSSDNFYNEDPDIWKLWAKFGVLAVEMESASLYTVAARFNVDALCFLTVSDHIVTREETTSEEREKTFTQMMELALETIIRAD